MEIYSKLSKICDTKENVNLKTMCSMHIGGVGDYVCYPKTIKQLSRLVNYLNTNKLEYFVVGNGTNIIFEDGGYSAVLICLKKMDNFVVGKKTIVAEAGLGLFAFNFACRVHGLGGMEWSFGIPATIGGAVAMNAGAYGHEISEFVKNVWVLKDGKIQKYTAKQMGFKYRKSRVLIDGGIIVKASFCLKVKSTSEIEQLQNQIFAYRKCCQPYGTYNAGSIFKKSNGISAGKTIDKLGLKSVKIGDIQISDKHANFFINLGNGKSADLHKLIETTKAIVKSQENIDLEEEVVFVSNKRE